MCTLQRVGWTIDDASTMVTDLGQRLDLHIDPPVVIGRKMCEPVRRWRWRTMAESHADLPPEGANFAPIIKLLTSKRDDDEWNGMLIAVLRSVVANRQFP